jgi:hypothetical protein
MQTERIGDSRPDTRDGSIRDAERTSQQSMQIGVAVAALTGEVEAVP